MLICVKWEQLLKVINNVVFKVDAVSAGLSSNPANVRVVESIFSQSDFR